MTKFQTAMQIMMLMIVIYSILVMSQFGSEPRFELEPNIKKITGSTN